MIKAALTIFVGHLVGLLFFLALLALALSFAYAGDPTGYWARESAAGRAPPKAWWDALASGKVFAAHLRMASAFETSIGTRKTASTGCGCMGSGSSFRTMPW